MNTSPPKPIFPSSSSSHWPSGLSSSASSSSSSSSPQLSRVKSVETSRVESTLAQRRMFRQQSSDSFRLSPIRPQEASCSQERSLQEPRKLADKGTRFKWFHWFTREGILRDVLLSDARDKEKCRSITKIELENILECCRQQSEGLFASKLKCQILGFRILHYLSENRLQLSQSAIDTLIDKLREPKLNSRILPYVTMALGYAIYFDSKIRVPDGENLFDRAIDELLGLDKKKYFEAIVIALIAKAKQVGSLSERDLSIIQQALADPDDSEPVTLYRPSGSHVSYPRSQHLVWYRSRVGILEKIKNHVKTGKLISRRELGYVLHCYNLIDDARVRNKIVEIIQLVFSNNQRQLHHRDPEALISVLQQVLTDEEFKIRSRALIIANTLSVNHELPGGLQSHYLLGRYRQRFYALSALRQHLQGIDRTKFAENPIWKRLLEQINHQAEAISDNREKADSLKDLANYILFQLSDHKEDLEYLIFKEGFAVFITGDYLNEVIQRKSLTPSVMRKLQQLILEFRGQVPLEASLNAIAIFRYVAENGSEVDPKILEYAITTVEDPESDIRFKEVALMVLWAALPNQSDKVICSELLTGLPACLTHKKLISASCSLLSVWLEKIPAPHFDELFSRVFNRTVDAFSMVHDSPNDQLFLMQVLGRAAEKGFVFPDELITRMIFIAESSKDPALQDSFVSVLRVVLRKRYEIKLEMEWSKELFELLFRLSQSDQASYLLNAGSALCCYMTILKKGMLPDSEMDRLATLFSNERTAHFAVEVFDELVLRAIPLTENSLLKLASIMLENTLEIHSCVASLLRLVSKYQPFSEEAINKVIKGLSFSEELVVVSCVQILTEQIFVLNNSYKRLGKKSVGPLIEIAAKEYYHLDARRQACSILINFSKRFPLVVLEQAIALLSDRNQHIQLSCIQLLEKQARYLSVSIASKNPFIDEIEEKILPCLKSDLLRDSAIRVLCTLGIAGYALSDRSLEELSVNLYVQNDFYTCTRMWHTLEKFEERLKPLHKLVVRIQQDVLVLRNPDIGLDAKIVSLSHLIAYAQAKERMVASVFQALNVVVRGASYELIDLSLEFCLVVLQHGEAISPELLHSLIQLRDDQLNQDRQTRRSLVVSHCLRQNSSVDSAAFMIVERGFLNEDLSYQYLYLYLEALNVAVSRSHVIAKETVKKLWTILFYFNNEEVQIISAEILINSFTSEHFDGCEEEYPIDGLLTLIKKISSQKLLTKLNGLLARLNQLKILNEDQFEMVCEEIQTAGSFEQQLTICELFASKCESSHLPQRISDVILFKKLEGLYLREVRNLSPAQPLNEIVTQLSNLSSRPQLVSQEFFIVTACLLDRFDKGEIGERSEIESIIYFLGVIGNKQLLPDLIFDGLLHLANRYFCNLFHLFDHHLRTREPLGEMIVLDLALIMLEHPDASLRLSALEILRSLASYQELSDGLSTLVALESDQESERSVERIHQHVQQGGRLSVGNGEILLRKLKNGEERQTILSIFDQVKSELPRALHHKIFEYYRESFSDLDNQPYFTSFCLDALKHERVGKSIETDFVDGFYGYFQTIRPLTTSEFHLLYFLIRSAEKEMTEAVLENVIQFFATTNELLLREQCLFLIFGYLISLPDWSKDLLNRLAGLKLQFHLTCPTTMESNGIESLVELTRLSNHSSAEPSVLLNLHEIETFLNWFAYVAEDERSAGYFNQHEGQRKLLPHIPDEELFHTLLRRQPPSQLSSESEKVFEALLLKLQLHETHSRRQIVRLLICKQRQDQLSLDQLNKLLGMISSFPYCLDRLLQQDLNGIRRRVIENLLSKFDFFTHLLHEPKKQLLLTCQKLEWDAESIHRLICQLSPRTGANELLQLFSLMNDYSVNPDEIETILESSIDECPASTLISEVMAFQLVSVLQPFLSSNIGSDRSEQRWLEWTISSALSLCKQGWNFDALIDWLERTGGAFEGKSVCLIGINEIAGLLSFAVDFQAEIEEECFYRIVDEHVGRGERKILESLHAYLVEHYLSAINEEKNLQTLLEEIADPTNNPKGFSFTHELNFKEIRRCLKRTKELYENEQKDLLRTGTTSRPIKEWSMEEITSWADERKRIRNVSSATSSSSGNFDVAVCLALFKRASVLLYKYEPRLIQLISTLILTDKTNPILSQIATGEGKSFIVAMIAAMKALQGTPVDVLTSSAVLAKRDAELYRPFYKLFSLKVASNEDDRYETGLKGCYAPNIDVVYGDPSNFQFDLLQDEYSGLKTRGKRRVKSCAVVIDEADNVLIEGNDTTAMLASPMPGMQELTPLLICIWLKLVSLDPLKDYRLTGDENGLSIDEEEFESVRKSTETQLLRHIEGITEETEQAIKIPRHLESFVQRESKYWVHSAWLAFYEFKPKHHYEIKLNQEGVLCVAPVDFANTGVIQVGTSWGEGLHQFIQIKHDLPVEPLTLVTNYSSIHSYIKRYPDRVGMTGTLGSNAVKGLLKKMFGFHSIEIPTFLSRKQLKLPPRILPNKESWIESIAFGSIREAQLGRVVLIICETIDICGEMEQLLSTLSHQTRLHNYSDDKNESNHFLEKVHDGNTIIVATNLAGRGTDIKISEEVKNRGGVHVCVTFLPVNSRVQQQAFGRASRRGEPGTVQLVLNHETLKGQLPSASDEELKKLDSDPKLVEILRDKEESLNLKQLEEKRLPEIQLQDELFLKYLALLKRIRMSDKKAKEKRGVKQLADDFFADSIYREEEIKAKREALQEQWGRWLRKLSSQRMKYKKIDDFKDVAMSKFEAFDDRMTKAYHLSRVVDNPMYYIRLGNELLTRSNALHHYLLKGSLCEYAIQAYNHAIEMDSIFSYNALYHKAYALIQLARGEYKEEAKKILHTMRKGLLNGPLQQLDAVALLMDKCKTQEETIAFQQLERQLEQERQVYGLLMQSSEQAIKQIEESQKLIEIDVSATPCFSQVSCPRFTKEEAFEKLKHESTPPQVGLTFHHLKAHHDLTVYSQLEMTFKTLSPDIQTITLSFRSEELYSERGKKYSLRALLPINRHRMLEVEIKHSTELVSVASSEIIEGTSSSSSSSQPNEEKAVSFGEHWERGEQIFGKVLKKAGKTLGDFARPVTNPIKSFVIKTKEELVDLWQRCKDTVTIPVTLTLTNLSSLEISSKLKTFGFAETQVFGIGPFEFTPQLLNGLKEHLSAESNVTIWFSPKYVEENKEWEHYRPKEIKVSDLSLDLLGGEISILECSRLQLKKVLKLIHSEESSLTWVLHHLDQTFANRCIKQNLDQPSAAQCKTQTSHPMTLSFVGLNVEKALKIAELTEHEHNQATLTIEGISSEMAQRIIAKADRTEQKVLINHRKIQTEFSKINEKPSFIHAHRLNGYYYLYDLHEQLPLPWKSLVLLTTLSMAQIAGGVALMSLTAGFGASVGQGLVAEGAVDAIRALKTMHHREFDLSSYAVQKAVSLSLILISGGFSNISKARTAGEVANDTMKVKSVLLKTATTYGDASYQSVKSTAMISRKLIASIQQVGLEFGENVSREIVKTSLNATTQAVLNRVEPSLKKNIRSVIQDMFKKDYWDGVLHKMFAVDAFLGNQNQFQILEVKVRSLIVNAEFKGQRLTVFDREVLAQFEKEFDQCLNETSNLLKDVKGICRGKLMTMGSDFDRIWDLLIQAEIISPSGMINVAKKEDYVRRQSLRESSTASQLRELDLSEARTKQILEALSVFRRHLRDDYYIQKRKLINTIHQLFYEQFEHSLKTVAQAANIVVSSGANIGISIGFCQASSQISDGLTQEGSHDFEEADNVLEASSSTSTHANTNVNATTRQSAPQMRKGDTSIPASQMNKRTERRLLMSSKRVNQAKVKGSHRFQLHRQSHHKLIHLSAAPRTVIPTSSLINAAYKSSATHFTIRAICGVASGSLQALHAACWSEYQYSLKRIEEQTQCLLSLKAISEAEKIVVISRDLRKEQISSIRKLISRWLIEGEMKEQKILDERKIEALDIVIDEIVDKCREDQDMGRSPIYYEARRIGVSEEQSSTHPYLQDLLKGWNHYKKLEGVEREALTQLLGYIDDQLLVDKGVDFAKQHRYSELGVLIQMRNGSVGGCIGGVIIQHLGNVAKTFIEGKKLSNQLHARLQCMSMALMHQTLAQQSTIQQEILHQVEQRDAIVEKIVAHQTEIAKIVQDNHGKFLQEFSKIGLIEKREDRLREAERMKQEYFDHKQRIDEIVLLQISIVKANSSAPDFLTQCAKQAAEIVPRVIDLVKEISEKDGIQVREFSQQIERTMRGLYSEGVSSSSSSSTMTN